MNEAKRKFIGVRKRRHVLLLAVDLRWRPSASRGPPVALALNRAASARLRIRIWRRVGAKAARLATRLEFLILNPHSLSLQFIVLVFCFFWGGVRHTDFGRSERSASPTHDGGPLSS